MSGFFQYKYSCGNPDLLPLKYGIRFTPSISFLIYFSAFAADATVAKISNAIIGLSYIVPGSILFGHCIANGTLIPPSKKSPLIPLKGPLSEKLYHSTPPLSEKKNTIVFSKIFFCSSLSNINPIPSSIDDTIAA